MQYQWNPRSRCREGRPSQLKCSHGDPVSGPGKRQFPGVGAAHGFVELHMSAIKEYIAQQKEAENVQGLDQLVSTAADTSQPSREQPLQVIPREEPTKVTHKKSDDRWPAG